MRKAIRFFAVLIFLPVGLADSLGVRAADDDGILAALQPAPLGCTIRSEPTCELGKEPKVSVAIINQTRDDIYLVGCLDASDSKSRYPHCYFEVTGPDGKSVEKGGMWCGFMNALQQKDFVKVPARKRFDPYQSTDRHRFFSAHQLNARNFTTPGEYRIRFFYSTKSNDIGEWAGSDGGKVAADQKIAAMFRRVPKVELQSDKIKITVVDPAK